MQGLEKFNASQCNGQIKYEKTTLLVIKEMQIEITKIYLFFFSFKRLAKMQKLDNTLYGQGYGEIGSLMCHWLLDYDS